MNLPTDFDAFLREIELGQKQLERIEGAATTLTDYLRDRLGLGADDIFLQGSVANDTAIKPDPERERGEYDVDLVVVCAGATDTPEQALDGLESVLAESGNYRDKIDRDPERPCVRLVYADDEIGGFHVDVVPARRSTGEAPLEIPRPGEGWAPSAPREYTTWCQQQGPRFARTVKMLKRWRDHNQTAREAIKSIVLQVLISDHMPQINSDGERIARTLRTISDFLNQHPSKPEIRNPVLECEVLSDRWDEEAYEQFKGVAAEAADRAERALGEGNRERSRALWQELFGNSFPGPEAPSTKPALAPGEQDLLADFDIPTRISGRVKIDATVRKRDGFRNGDFKHLLPLQKNRGLDFKIADTDVATPFDVYWKVKNNGEEARRLDALRGEIRRDDNAPNAWKYERTLYTGNHYVEIYVVKDGICVARDRVDVPIQ